MIIKSKAQTLPGENSIILESELEADKFRILHGQQIDGILEECHAYRKLDGNGFTDGRNMRKIASIPAIEFTKHPEWAHDTKAMIKWLKSEEGRMYLTVRGGV